MTKKFNVIVVGLGHQSIEDHLPAIQEIPSLRLIGVVDIDPSVATGLAEKYHVPYGLSVEDLLQNITKPDIAIIALPHNQYLPIINLLAKEGVHIIKEKPFAVSVCEAKQLIDISKKHNVSIQVTLQRRYNPIFKTFCQLVKRIGRVHSVEARYTLNIKDLSEGWRSKKELAGGGALVDMGYHYIDLFIWYFGMPDKIKCRMSGRNRINQKYDVEDTVFLDFTYDSDDKNILASLYVSRVHSEKNEGLTAHGSNGSVSVTRGRVARYDVSGRIVEELVRTDAWPSAIIDQLETLVENISLGQWEKSLDQYMDHAYVLEASYASAATNTEIDPRIYMNKIQ